MTINEILTILDNRILNLTESRKAAVTSGLLDQVILIDNDMESTKTSIQALKETLTLPV
jgi:hypothetical protein